MEKRLCDLNVGSVAEIIRSAHVEEAMVRRLKELGFEENASVYCVGESPLGGMKAYLIKRAVIALRNGDAVGISVNVNDTERQL